MTKANVVIDGDEIYAGIDLEDAEQTGPIKLAMVIQFDTAEDKQSAINARSVDLGFYMCDSKEYETLGEQTIRPSVAFKPRLSVDGNKWCALYGDDLMEGVAGFGDSPAEAMLDFDRNWNIKLSAQRAPVAEIDKLRSELSAAKDAVLAALPAMREYARKNPTNRINASLPERDPNGVHAWLAINDK